MIKHYKLVFKGYIEHTFYFDVHRSEEELDWILGCGTDEADHICTKDDGYLYIEGYKITNNSDGINTICSNLYDGNIGRDSGHSYIEAIFSIDSRGYVICNKHRQAASKTELFLSRFL